MIKPGDSAGLYPDIVTETGQHDLLTERWCRRHSEMSNGYFQPWTFLNDLSHLANLLLVVGKTHREDELLRLHVFEHGHHAEERFAMKNKKLDEAIAVKAKVQKVLTPEQFKKWEDMKKENRENMKERMEKRRDKKSAE